MAPSGAGAPTPRPTTWFSIRTPGSAATARHVAPATSTARIPYRSASSGGAARWRSAQAAASTRSSSTTLIARTIAPSGPAHGRRRRLPGPEHQVDVRALVHRRARGGVLGGDDRRGRGSGRGARAGGGRRRRLLDGAHSEVGGAEGV